MSAGRSFALIHHRLGFSGGMESYFLELIRGFHALGYHLTVYTARWDAGVEVPAGVEVCVCCSQIWPKMLRKYHFAYQVKRHLQKKSYDAVISTTRSFSQDLLITGGTHRGYQQALKRCRLSDFLESYLEARAYSCSPKIIAHSPALKEELIQLYGVPAERIRMIYPPVDTAQFQFQSRPSRGDRPYRLLFASTSHRRKGGMLLLEAFKQLPADQFELWIVGRPFPEAERLTNVRSFGYVQEIAQYYEQADLLVLPSRFEPFGLVVVQALECGMPVLISKAVGAGSLVGSQEGLILQEETPEALKQLILQARETHFEIQPHFAARNGLSGEVHLQQILAWLA